MFRWQVHELVGVHITDVFHCSIQWSVWRKRILTYTNGRRWNNDSKVIFVYLDRCFGLLYLPACPPQEDEYDSSSSFKGYIRTLELLYPADRTTSEIRDCIETASSSSTSIGSSVAKDDDWVILTVEITGQKLYLTRQEDHLFAPCHTSTNPQWTWKNNGWIQVNIKGCRYRDMLRKSFMYLRLVFYYTPQDRHHSRHA